jgi:pyridoxamine 5'-phosphate oxidase-like protein
MGQARLHRGGRRMTGPQLAGYLARRTYALASTTRPDGRAHAAPTLFSIYAEAFWLPTLGSAARLGNVRAHPWLALSILEGEHDTHAAVLTEGPAEVLATVPADVRSITELRNRGGSLDSATDWLRMTPQRLFSFAELAWQGASPAHKRVDRGSLLFRCGRCQYCCHDGGQRLPLMDNSGISAQPTDGDGGSWTVCPCLRIRRLGFESLRTIKPTRREQAT